MREREYSIFDKIDEYKWTGIGAIGTVSGACSVAGNYFSQAEMGSYVPGAYILFLSGSVLFLSTRKR